MKFVTKNISLAEDLAKFATTEAEEGGYATLSSYFAELVRARRQAQIAADVELLANAMRHAPGEEPVDEIVSEVKATRRQMQKEGWRP
jgi:hypothetical protein